MNSHSLQPDGRKTRSAARFGSPPVAVPSPRRRSRSALKDDRRHVILRAAAKAFKKKGFPGTTMSDISRELDMVQGNLYHYFTDKEDILFQCHDYSLNLVLSLLDELNGSDLPADEKLRRVIEFHVGVMIDELQASAMALDFHALSGARLHRIITKRDKYERGLRRIIEDGIRTGAFKPLDVKHVTFSILGAINWIARWFSPGGESSAPEIAGTFSEIFLGGLRK